MTLEFSSRTDEDFERKKYNLLLRSALILLCPFIRVQVVTEDNLKQETKRITSILSRAINPISIYSLAKYFHAFNEDLTNFMTENNIHFETITLENVRDFYDSLNTDDMELDENMDEQEIDNFLKNNPNFGDPIVLMELIISDIELKKQTGKIFIETINKIGCPSVSSTVITGGKKKKTKQNKPNLKKKKQAKTNKNHPK